MSGNNQIMPIELGDNFDFDKLSDVQKLICMPGVLSEMVLAVTNPKLRRNKDAGNKNNENQENVNSQNKNEDKYADYENIETIRENIEKVKDMNPDDFVNNGKFDGLPEEIKVVMLYRIFELKGDSNFDYQKSFAENLREMNKKYKKYSAEVLLKLLRLKFENKINSVQADVNTNQDFVNPNNNLAQAIKNFLNGKQNKDLSNGLKNVLFEYYAFFNMDQNEIEQIKNGAGGIDFRVAMQTIKNTQDYKDADENHKDAIVKGKLKACNIRWDYNAEYIAESCSDLSETEKIMVIPYLNNFYLQKENKKNISNAEELAKIFFNRTIEGKKFTLKVRAEMVKNFVLKGAFFEVPIQNWLSAIVKQIGITDESLKNIPEDMIAALASHVFDVQKEPKYNFSNDFATIDIEQILNGVLKDKDKINAFREKQEKQKEKYKFSTDWKRLVNDVREQHELFFLELECISETGGPMVVFILGLIFLSDFVFYIGVYPLFLLKYIVGPFVARTFDQRSFLCKCFFWFVDPPFLIFKIAAGLAALLVCSPVIIYWCIQRYRELVRGNNEAMADVEENNLDLNNMHVNEINPDINQNIYEQRLDQLLPLPEPVVNIADGNQIVR